MHSRPCMYAPGPWGNCLDLDCAAQGGRCKYIGGRRGRSRCVCRIKEPSRNVAGADEGETVNELDLYRSHVAKLPECSEADFSNLLGRYRAGDEEAGRAITGG